MCGVALALLGAACSSTTQSSKSGGGATTTEVPTTRPIPVKLAMSPAGGSTGVALDLPVNVTATDGSLTDVTAVNTATGAPLLGAISDGGASWKSVGALAPDATYKVAATAKGNGAEPTRQEWTFTTLHPADELHTKVNVGAGRTYGVGVPIIVQLNHPIGTDERAAVEQRLTVTAAPGVVGAWRWFSSQELHWRPSQYYPANTPVSLKIDFAGLDAGNGVWGVDGRTIDFKIGDAHISTVDAATHTMTVSSNGQVVKTIPVSTGRDQYPTNSGVHVVNEKMSSIVMDSQSVGIPRDSPDGYFEEVKWDVRISNSGEFVHAAPWSAGDQGSSNVSHGCVNVSDADGQWFYEFSQVGDVVAVTGTPDQLEPYNGYGDWQIPWDQWPN